MTKTKKRGDRMDTGGRFVGITRAGVVWVCYPGEDFRAMCEAFDELEKRNAA